MYKKVKDILISHWIWTLIVLALFSLVINILIFYPGYMSTDSLNQLRQALGTIPMIDLTPPTMTFLWKFMITWTGYVSSMLILHLLLLWTALAALAVYTYHITKRYALSISVLAIGFLPFVINISGVVWKDNSMTFSLLLAAVGILYLPIVKRNWLKVSFCSAIALLLLYASLVRYNALIAILPLVFLLISRSGFVNDLRLRILCLLAFGVIVAGFMTLINKIGDVKATNPISAVMIDDVLNVGMERSKSIELQKTIDSLRECRQAKNVIINNFWVCANDQDRVNIQHSHYNEMKDLWLSTVIQNPFSYGIYRLETFAMFIFPSQLTNYYWQNGIESNELGYQAKIPKLGHIIELYVRNFAFSHLSFLYETWFWLLMNISVLVYTYKRKISYLRNYILTLGYSGILYIIGYLPTGATSDYRYIYWPVFTFLVCAILIFSMGRLRLSRRDAKRILTDT